ncbi:MAG: maleylpyruvate isomerase N-terminal domain-containing protein [Chloroflexi bacterium]|nr:maleylpyruvate isomerase N-terminal domain-containing protein [Chloroflexota bacterium]
MNDTAAPYFEAVAFFRQVVGLLRTSQWDQPGLGVWSVRELVGHTSRALANVERDIRHPLPHPGDGDRAADYFSNVLATPNQASGVAERGRQAGSALGDDPQATIELLEQTAREVLAATPPDARVATPYARLPLDAYLDTKIFELVVHTLDICRAADIQAPPPAGPLARALGIALDLAARNPDRARQAVLLHALTGRTPLPDGFSVL